MDLGGASRASTVFGVIEEGLISSGVRKLRVPLHFGLRSQGPFRVGTGESGLMQREAKDSALLSSRDGHLLEPTLWPKGSQASRKFGERTWDCSPGHAGKDAPHLAMTEGSCGFSPAAAPVWGFTRGMTGSSGSLSCGAREVRSPCAWRGGAHYCSRAMVGESDLKTH